MLNHPGVASLSCDDCEKWVVECLPEVGITGKIPRDPRTKQYIIREGSPPCDRCAKCYGKPPGKINPQGGRETELSAKNQLTVQAYWQTKATGEVVTDSIQRRNFGLIEKELVDHTVRLEAKNSQLLQQALKQMTAR